MKKLISFILVLCMVMSLSYVPVFASDTTSATTMNPSTISKDWNGEYDGYGNYKVVRRNIEIHIKEIKDDGAITGTAIIQPSQKESDDYGVNGSYYFKGTIDLETKNISLQGYEWIDYPVGTYAENFTFVKLSGTINEAGNKIEGKSDNGVWTMNSMDYSKVSTDSAFTLGRDNNSFMHSNEKDCGFEGHNTYQIDDAYYNRLTKNSSKSEKDRIKKNMQETWGGSCYGIASTMGLLYEGYLKISDLNDGGAANYFSMPYPCKDQKLLNMINFYQLSQYLDANGQEATSASETYNYGWFTGLVNWAGDYDSLSSYLKNLVNALSNNHVIMLGFSTKDWGHAVLVTGCTYNESKDAYEINLYDENSVRSAGSQGEFHTMEVAKDYSSFSFKDGNGDTIDKSNFNHLYFTDWEKLKNLNALGSAKATRGTSSTNHVKISIPKSKTFVLTNREGRKITCDGQKMSGNMKVYTVGTSGNDKSPRVEIETTKSSSYTLTGIEQGVDVEVFQGDDYISLQGNKISQANISLSSGVTLKGTDYSFKACVSTDNEVAANENGLVEISGNAATDVQIKRSGDTVVATSEGNMTNLHSVAYVGTNVEEKTYPDGTTVTANAKFDAKEEIPVQTPTTNVPTKGKQVFKYTKTYNKAYGCKKFKLNAKLKKGDGKLTYRSSNKKVATVTKKGMVTVKGTGVCTLTVNAKASSNFNAAKASITLKVSPKKASLTKVTPQKGKKLSVKWKKDSRSSGYQIQYSTNRAFKKSQKKTMISKKNITNKTLKKLKKGKKYYVRVRAYKTVKIKGKKMNLYGAWSVKKISKSIKK
ncbi:uncharacterized protein containing predicted phosphatase domain [Lachnospiraceae bacterium KM106-2]|nr:uncharacterized protein containing predicted phosphatase domain [Lachnospiraceae bacterium KM106-2]